MDLGCGQLGYQKQAIIIVVVSMASFYYHPTFAMDVSMAVTISGTVDGNEFTSGLIHFVSDEIEHRSVLYGIILCAIHCACICVYYTFFWRLFSYL